MSKAFKTAGSVGAVALILSGAAMAAAPFAEGFDQWTASTGTIGLDYGSGATCPSGFSCAAAVTGEGFYQRQITDGSGNDYFQTIITDKTADGAPGALSFSDESYVRTGNVSGLADKTQMLETTTGSATLTNTFIGSTELGTGWANAADGGGSGTANDVVLIYQAIEAEDTAVGGEDFDARFWLQQTGPAGATGKHMRISSQVDIQEDASQPGSQEFVLVELSGSAEVSAGGSIGLSTGGTIDWATGERIKAIWVGQDMSLIDGVAQEFGYTAYEDLTSTVGLTSEFSLEGGSSSAPVSWTTGLWGSSTAGTTGPF